MTLEEKQALLDSLATLILAKPLPFLLQAGGGVITPAISARIILHDFTKPSKISTTIRHPGPCQVIPFRRTFDVQ